MVGGPCFEPERLRLLLITSRRVSRSPIVSAVRSALRGGVTAVMVREPDLSARDLLALVRELAGPVRERQALLLVNDRIDVALAAGADGVHLKRSSLGASDARRLLGPFAVIGVSTHEEEEVTEAFREGADYVVFGPVEGTPKEGPYVPPRGLDRYAGIVRRHSRPVLALGGIDSTTAERAAAMGAPGVAAIRALLDVADPEDAARRMREAFSRGRSSKERSS